MILSEKLENAQKTFEKWRTLPFSERQQYLFKLGDLLENNAEKFGKNITQEMNKPLSQSIAEIEKCALMARYYGNAANILKPEKIKTEYKGKVNVVFMNLMEPESKRFFEYYGVATIPTQILLDRKGKEFFRHTGFYPADELSTHFTMKK